MLIYLMLDPIRSAPHLNWMWQAASFQIDINRGSGSVPKFGLELLKVDVVHSVHPCAVTDALDLSDYDLVRKRLNLGQVLSNGKRFISRDQARIMAKESL